MFKLFKSRKSTGKIIAEIHNEFDSASERLLKEAKELLSGINTEKADRLSKLGFSNAKAVKETKEATELKRKNEALASKVEYFRQWYPHNKFITEEAIEAICKKYNLVFGNVANYKGDVPEKNIREMEGFVLRKEDMNKRSDWEKANESYMWQQRTYNLMGGLPQYRALQDYSQDEIKRMSEKYTYSQPPFKICAPESDFDTRHLMKSGYKLIPDPIVLQPVNGGYLIVTKWGLEASDDLVKNEKAN